LFFALLLSGIVLILLDSGRKKNSPETVRRIGAGLLVEGLAFVGFAIANVYLIRTSDKPVVEGNIWAIRQTYGKNRGTSFHLTDEAGRAVLIRCRYNGPGFHEGERARVRYIRYNRQLLEITMLSGPYTRWHFQESSGQMSAALIGVLGVVCFIGGYRQWHKPVRRSRAAEDEPQGSDVTSHG
jgi:hypothetical protein